jgi:uncharacterized protein YdhG (YjbR/CyaY superfamily)
MGLQPAPGVNRARAVDAYIEDAPKEVRPKLRELREAIRHSAPEAVESISYTMPFYSFRGQTGFEGRLCYFGLLRRKIVFYTRPAFLEGLRDEVEPYLSTKSALHFREDQAIPVHLIAKLIGNAIRKHGAEADDRKASRSRRRPKR